MLERVRESQLALADGRFGSAGSALLELDGRPRVLAGGVYVGAGPESRLLCGPLRNPVVADATEASDPPTLRRTLDLHTGVLEDEIQLPEGRARGVSFACFARPGVFVLRARAPSARVSEPPLLRPAAADGGVVRQDARSGWISVATREDGGVAAAAKQQRLDSGATATIDRVAAHVAVAAGPSDGALALDEAERAERVGFECLLAEQRAAWASRWEAGDVVIEGDDELQRDVRFALFHLMASAADSGEAAVGARGLSGPAYRGHVFWDADVFVLPFFAATHPESARAMLEYRVRRLAPAMARARAEGREGARFPWESAGDGTEATPVQARDQTGRVVAIHTGRLEEHIVADVAWSAACYVDWTGDEGFRAGDGAHLLIETARYWASRARVDGAGKAHIDGVIGPDEYHEGVDDNAFTNGMARWNLRRAAALPPATHGVAEPEARRWLEIANALVDGYDAATGVYEQHAGFRQLEPLVIARIAGSRPIAADILLGRERVARAQVVKQTDVLMLHHLVPDEVAAGSLVPNLNFYEPRTAHGSTLSIGIHAALFARAGRLDEAVRWLRLASRIDLDDLSESTAGGVHLAAMGSVWQALAFGFAGIRPLGDALAIDPRLPDAWRALELRLRFRESRVSVRIEPERTLVRADPPLRVAFRAGEPVVAGPEGTRLAIRSHGKGGAP
jgi:trehalose/maltose hydrolase-like predicted phosphorylase